MSRSLTNSTSRASSRSPRESAVLASIIRYLQNVRIGGTPIMWLKIHGGAAQRMGEPDLHVTMRGRSYWLEVKRPGEEATDLQRHRLSQWRAAGAKVAVVRSVDDVKRLFNQEQT